MSLVSALYTGVSGIQAFSSNMQVIGNNIANVNTVGFKATSSQFADLVSGGLNVQIGRGVRLSNTSTSFSQGSFQNTSNITDMAVDGEGFFVLKDPSLLGQSFSRTGVFDLNSDGLLENADGQLVQGYSIDGLGNVSTVLSDINLNNLQSPPQETTEVTLYANLNAEDAVIAGGFDPADPTNTSNYFTSARVFDSQGVDHVVTIYFTKTGDNAWSWSALVADSEISDAVPGNGEYEVEASGTLAFNAFGSLQTVTTTSSEFNFTGGVTAAQAITFNFGDAIDDGGTGLGGTAQYSNPSLVNFMSQDGYTSGSLRGIAIDNSGKITGVFSNGKTRDVSQVALATFQNESGLIKTGGNTWVKSPTSGEPTIQPPGSGAAGLIISSTLELSNVDLANEFVQLIANQRALQASSRVLTTSDDMLQEVVNLKR